MFPYVFSVFSKENTRRVIYHPDVYDGAYNFVLNCDFSHLRKKKQDEEEAEQKRKATETAYQGRFSLHRAWVIFMPPFLRQLWPVA